MNLTHQGEGTWSWSSAEKRPTYRNGRPQWSDKEDWNAVQLEQLETRLTVTHRGTGWDLDAATTTDIEVRTNQKKYQWEKIDACTLTFAWSLTHIFPCSSVLTMLCHEGTDVAIFRYWGWDWSSCKLTSSLIILRYLWLINFVNEFYPELTMPWIFIVLFLVSQSYWSHDYSTYIIQLMSVFDTLPCFCKPGM
jgi:hypothetical protein